jgi:hypothetical protein
MFTISQCVFDTRLSFETVKKVFKHFRDAAASKHGRARRREASVRTRKLLDWSQKHLPHYFKSPPSRMHTWLAAQLEQLGTHAVPAGKEDGERGRRGEGEKTRNSTDFCGTGFQPVKNHGQDGRATSLDTKIRTAPKTSPHSNSLPKGEGTNEQQCSHSPSRPLSHSSSAFRPSPLSSLPSPSKKLNILAPRGAAKSTLGTLAFVLKSALEKVEPYIWIVSDTKHQACAHLENIKDELTNNKSLAADYPAAAVGPKWRSNRITLNNGVPRRPETPG